MLSTSFFLENHQLGAFIVTQLKHFTTLSGLKIDKKKRKLLYKNAEQSMSYHTVKIYNGNRTLMSYLAPGFGCQNILKNTFKMCSEIFLNFLAFCKAVWLYLKSRIAQSSFGKR